MTDRLDEIKSLRKSVIHWEGEVEAYAGEVERLEAVIQQRDAEIIQLREKGAKLVIAHLTKLTATLSVEPVST